MSDKDNGGPAFPTEQGEFYHSPGNQMCRMADLPGMTLRDYFAAKAMQSMLSSMEMTALVGRMATEFKVEKSDAMASTAYDFADAMLRHRIK